MTALALARELAPRMLTPSVPEGLLDDSRFPHYGKVPKGLKENVAYRRRIRVLAATDRVIQAKLLRCCRDDLLFFVNVFVDTFNPLVKDHNRRILPFVTWPFQDVTLAAMVHAIGLESMVVEKVRYMGATWMMLVAFLWKWLFEPYSTFLVASRKEDLVDSRDNPDTLFWKLDFMRSRLPRWMRPKIRDGVDRTMMHLFNPLNNSVTDGETTNDDLSAGGRRLAVGLDELGRVDNAYSVLDASGAVTNSRIIVSSHATGGSAFADVCDSGILKAKLEWTMHPELAAGKYQREDGSWRSPFLDQKERESVDPMEFAQNWLGERVMQDYQFFSAVVKATTATCLRPMATGALAVDLETCRATGFVEEDGGPLSLWFYPDGERIWDRSEPCVIGWDVAHGYGNEKSSNTVGVVVGRKTRQVLAEWVTNRINPETAGKYATALAWVFCDRDGVPALTNWESGGPGWAFGKAIIDTGFRNIWYRPSRPGDIAPKMTDSPGWVKRAETTEVAFSALRKAYFDGELIERSLAAVRELQQYIRTKTKLEHSRALSNVNPNEVGINHGDRVIARAVAWMAVAGGGMSATIEEKVVTVASFMGRRMERRRVAKELAAW